jgi:hypothetical protein
MGKTKKQRDNSVQDREDSRKIVKREFKRWGGMLLLGYELLAYME